MTSLCPNCSNVLDRDSRFDVGDGRPRRNVKPRPGDYTFCFYCESILIYDDRLDRRLAELAKVPPEILAMWDRFKRAKNEMMSELERFIPPELRERFRQLSWPKTPKN